MATVEVKNLEGQTVRDFQIADEIFGAKPNQSLLWEAVKQYLASQRRGTHSTKSRGEVSGGGKKPWRQKGTGRARVGSIRSSLWRHGSIAHGPQAARLLLRASEGNAARGFAVGVGSEISGPQADGGGSVQFGRSPRPRVLSGALHKLGLEKGVLVVDDAANRNLELSSRNVKGCDLVRRHELHPYHVLSHNQLLISEGALTRLQEALR